jgi:solute carrier family 25 iron transporter 28/37
MNIPFQGTHFVTYEFAQKLLNPERRYEPGVHFVCGAMAGAVAATATMPLDVCKTLLNTQEAGVLMRLDRAEVSGMLSAARSVYACAGLRGYFHGIRARLFYQMPSTAISWSVYEFFKHALLANDGASTAAAAAQQYDTIDRLAATDVNAPGLIAETLNRK